MPRFAKDLRRLEHDIVSLVEGTGKRRDENGLSRNGPERFFEKGWTKRFLAMEIPGARRIKGDVVAIPFRPPHEETAVPHDFPFPGSGMAVEGQRSETHRQPKRTATASADVIPKAVSRRNPCVQVRNQQSLKVDDDRNRGSPAEKTETPLRPEHVDQIGLEAVDNPQAIRNVPFVLFCQFEKTPHFRQMASVAQNGKVGNRPVMDGVGNAGTEKRNAELDVSPAPHRGFQRRNPSASGRRLLAGTIGRGIREPEDLHVPKGPAGVRYGSAKTAPPCDWFPS